MNRQKVRAGVLLISFFLLPVTLYYLSPVLIIEGASKGIVVGSFLLFGSLFTASSVLGRLFCGWICPAAGLQEACFRANDRTVRGGRYDLIKYIIWVPWVSVIVFFFIKAGGFHSISPFYATENGISVSDNIGYIIFYAVVGIITIMAFLWGRRAFCHYLCWISPFMVVGGRLGRILRVPSVKLKADKKECTDCKQCTKDCPMSLPVDKMVQDDNLDHDECILCGSCSDVCRKNVITYGFGLRKC